MNRIPENPPVAVAVVLTGLGALVAVFPAALVGRAWAVPGRVLGVALALSAALGIAAALADRRRAARPGPWPLPAAAPRPAGFRERWEQVNLAQSRLHEAGLPVEALLSAARWLESFSCGECGHALLGPGAAGLLAEWADIVLDDAAELAATLAAAREDGAR
jgi:hypothetical protein